MRPSRRLTPFCHRRPIHFPLRRRWLRDGRNLETDVPRGKELRATRLGGWGRRFAAQSLPAVVCLKWRCTKKHWGRPEAARPQPPCRFAFFAIIGLAAICAVSPLLAGEPEPVPESGGGRFAVYDLVPPPPLPAKPVESRPLPAGPVESRPLQRAGPIGKPLEGLTDENVIPAPTQEYTVDLSTVLQLAEADNPTIKLGREAIAEALALQLGARALVLPSLNAGAMYHLHQGTLQAGDGQIEKVNLQSVYFGGGDWTVGSQTVAVPAVHLFGNVGDAY